MRALAGLVVLAVAGTLVPATSAAAATPLKANITCDATTGAITTSVSGTLLTGTVPTPVTVEFQRRSGAVVSATTSTSLPPLAQPVTAKTTTTTSGDVSASGYTGTFDPVTSLYYRETVVATFRNTSSGATYTTREATCEHDQRTTTTLDCDPVAGTVTATTAGRYGHAGAADGAGRPTTVGYRRVQIVQYDRNDPRFTGGSFFGWDIQHRLTKAADGTWADAGYVHTLNRNRDYYYYAEEITVGVLDASGRIVGGGTAKCTLVDGSATPTA